MTDIALLVAEEYERKVKLTAEKGSSSAEVGWWNDFPAKMRMVGIEEKNIEGLKRKFDTKSQFALAVSNGFFSA
uniref:Uncharacterized protein n=2 Tax=Noccaea caerulescens TaxID=107243 RepID=A0A1J3GXY5_NOCCA